MKPATWADLEVFFKADDWVELRRTSDIHYEKELPGGEVLRSSRSSGKSGTAIGKDKFSEILRVQLKIDAKTFWSCVESGKPVERRVAEQAPARPRLPAWLARQLEREMGLRPDQLVGLTEDEAHGRLMAFRSRPR